MCSIATRTIPIAGPSITEKEIAYVTDAVTNSWYSRSNEYIDRFEKAFSLYTGRRFAISLPSCTSAIHLSLLALGIGPGDEVIVPESTWIATSAPISYVGAKPIFADIDLKTWCLSKETIEKVVTKKTKAIIIVNLYGHMPDLDPILKFCEKHQIALIEDAAESVGSKYSNKLSGSFGKTSCFSFHGSKTLTTGEGGMFLTDDEEIYRKVLIFRDHGRLPGDTLFRNFQVGHKYKMSALQAALGVAQLERIDELVAKKREIFSWYKRAFQDVKGVFLNPDFDKVFNSYWMSTLVFDKNFPLTKEQIILKLREQGIQTRPFFEPLSSLKAYDLHCKENKVAYDIGSRAINLPSAMSLVPDDIEYVKRAIISLLKI